MSALPAVRELEDDLDDTNIKTILIDIHSEDGSEAADDFDFEYTPTYLLFDGAGNEVMRRNDLPSQGEIRAALASS